MKSHKPLVFLVLMMLAHSGLFAQTENGENQENIIEHQNEHFALMLNENSSPQPEETALNNEVFIQQIGNGNTVNSMISSSNSSVHYEQTGNFNNIHAEITAEKVEHRVVQEGDRNVVVDMSQAQKEEISLNLIQTGDDLQFIRYGSNSIGDKLQFEMTGNSRSIIIRNF